jgi:hypothetical protein
MPSQPPSRGVPPGQPPKPKPKPKLSVIDESAAPTDAATQGGGKVRVEDFENPSAAPTRSADPGVPVNKSSRAVNPRKQFPLHTDLLMRDLFNRGQVPEQWQIVAAEETRLDETNWDVEFTIMDTKTNAVVRRVIEVQGGKLSRVVDR